MTWGSPLPLLHEGNLRSLYLIGPYYLFFFVHVLVDCRMAKMGFRFSISRVFSYAHVSIVHLQPQSTISLTCLSNSTPVVVNGRQLEIEQQTRLVSGDELSFITNDRVYQFVRLAHLCRLCFSH